MPRYKLVIEYSGTRYSGWQIQKNARTVQGEIDQAIGEVTRRREFELYGAGRTDAGVHALAQVAHLELYTDVPPAAPRTRIVGVLAAVGRGELTVDRAARFLEERSGIPATLTAPASGLFLEGVYYDGDAGPGPLRGVFRLD